MVEIPLEVIIFVGIVFGIPLTVRMNHRLIEKGIGDVVFKKLRAQQAGSSDTKVDMAVLRALEKDFFNPESPIGAILSFVPNLQGIVKKDPRKIIGIMNLISTIPNGLRAFEALKGFAKKHVPELEGDIAHNV